VFDPYIFHFPPANNQRKTKTKVCGESNQPHAVGNNNSGCVCIYHGPPFKGGCTHNMSPLLNVNSVELEDVFTSPGGVAVVVEEDTEEVVGEEETLRSPDIILFLSNKAQANKFSIS
jgi:hypothetical protein